MWLFLAVGAAICWGLDYAFSEQVFRHISILGSLALTTLTAGLLLTALALANGQLGHDIVSMLSHPRTILNWVAATVAFISADLLISASITQRNATMASVIELSYPMFVALFSYAIFGEGAFDTATLIGGALIFSGVVAVLLRG